MRESYDFTAEEFGVSDPEFADYTFRATRNSERSRHRISAYAGRTCRARVTDTYVRGNAVYAGGRLAHLSQPGKFLRPGH
ncbi:MAG: hypothetical protein ACREH8_12290 [Opitutaceae bacterium]